MKSTTESTTLSRGIFIALLGLLPSACLLHQTLSAGPPGQTTEPRPAVVQNRTAPTPSPVRSTDPIKKAEPGQQPTAKPATLPGAGVNYGDFKLGGSVYSTGKEDVIVRVLNSALVCPVPQGHNWPDLSPFNQGLYLLSPGAPRFIASNRDAGKTVNLGKLPPGELVFGIRVNDCDCYFQSGDASRNPDKLDHVSLRTFQGGGLVELWFEDAPGPRGTGRSDRDFNDLVVSISGVDNGAMADLAQAIRQQPAATQKAILTELEKLDPTTAAAVSSAQK